MKIRENKKLMREKSRATLLFLTGMVLFLIGIILIQFWRGYPWILIIVGLIILVWYMLKIRRTNNLLKKIK